MNLLKTVISLVALGFLFSCSEEISETNENQEKSSYLKKTPSQWEENDLYQVHYYQIGNLKKVENLDSFKLNEGLLIETISEKEYEAANREKNRYYLKDTLALIKIKNSIKIGKTVLTDKSATDGSSEFYNYLGYFPIMNQYLIRGEYLDSLDYKMIDKNSGEIKYSFIDYPIISQNGNFVTVCKTNEFENKTYFEIYNYSNGFYKNVFKAIFTNWRVVDFEKYAFWGNDGSFYLKIDRMNADDSSDETFLRITLN